MTEQAKADSSLSGLPPGLSELFSNEDPLGGLVQMLAGARRELAGAAAEGTAGGGLVRVCLSGDGRITSVAIDPEAMSSCDTGELGDLIVAAANSAFDTLSGEKSRRIEALTGLDLDGLGP